MHADINSGYAVYLDQSTKLEIGSTLGNLALANFGGTLVSLYTYRSDIDYTTYAGAGASLGRTATLRYRIYNGTTLGIERNLLGGVAGDSNAVQAHGRLFVVSEISGGYIVTAYGFSGTDSLALKGAVSESGAWNAKPVLVRTAAPEELHLLIWDTATKRVQSRRVNVTSAADGSVSLSLGPVGDVRTGSSASAPALLSNGPVGVTWNPRSSRMELLTTAHSRHVEPGGVFETSYRLRRQTLARTGSGWFVASAGWLTNDKVNWAGTKKQPTIIFDGRNPLGEYVVYYLRDQAWPDGRALTDVVRLDLSATVGSGADSSFRWTRRLMGNEWVSVRSAPAAAPWRDDIAFGLRLSEFAEPGWARNLMIVHLEGSGISESDMTDFDDVSFIANHGLRRVTSAAP